MKQDGEHMFSIYRAGGEWHILLTVSLNSYIILRVPRFLGSVLVACVAVTVFTGCASSASPISERSSSTPPTADSSAPIPSVPAGYDEMKNWSSGQTNATMQKVAAQLGLSAIYIPVQTFQDQGFTGVSPYEKRCVAVFTGAGADTTSGNVSMAVLSRYDDSLNDAEPNLDLQGARDFLQQEAANCT